MNDSGFSLIGVLSSAAIGAIVILGISQFQVNLMRSLKKAELKSNSIELSEEIVNLLEKGADSSEDCAPNAENLAKPPGKNVGDRCLVENACIQLAGGFIDAGTNTREMPGIHRSKIVTFKASPPHTVSAGTLEYGIYGGPSKDIFPKGLNIQKIELHAQTKPTDLDGDGDVTLYVYYGLNKEGSFPVLAPLEVKLRATYRPGTNEVIKCHALGGKLSSISDGGGDGLAECYKVTDDGRTLVGCGGTADTIEPKHTAFGFEAGISTTTETNTFIGYKAGKNNTSGEYNNFFGYETGLNSALGSRNNFLGYQAGLSNTSGNGNNFLGYQAGLSNQTGSRNNFLGHEAGRSNIEGSRNNFLGYQAGLSNTSGNGNNFLGFGAGLSNQTGSRNNFLGHEAGRSNIGGGDNNFLGFGAGRSNTTGGNNNFLGYQAGLSNTSGNGNNFLGFWAGLSNQTGSRNNFLGHEAGRSNIGEVIIISLDLGAGRSNTTGGNNNFLGNQAW